MNKVILMGRLTRDPDVRYSQAAEPLAIASYTLAVDRSFPSVKSREAGFFYGHPQNRFWKVLANVFQAEVPGTIEEKKAFLFEHRIAVWDVIGQCEITGSSDSSIRNVVPNPISKILETTKIEQIFVNGKKAEQLYQRYIYPQTKRNAICLPSTSPANASWNLEKLTEAWKIVLG